MMSFDQIKDAYEAFVRTHDVRDEVEWTEKKETNDDDRRTETETE